MLEGVGEAFQWLINGGDRRGADPPERYDRSDLSLQRTLSSFASDDFFSEDDTRPLPEVFVYDDDESKYSQSQSYELDACMGNAGSLLYDGVKRKSNGWPSNAMQWKLLQQLYQHRRFEPEGVSPRKKLLLQTSNHGGVDAEGSQVSVAANHKPLGSPRHEQEVTSFDEEVMKMALRILAENQALKHSTNIQRLLEDSDSSPIADSSPRKSSVSARKRSSNVTSPCRPCNTTPPPTTLEPDSSDNSILQTLQRAFRNQTSNRPAPQTCFDSTLFSAIDATLDTSFMENPAQSNAKAPPPPEHRQQQLSASKPLSVTSSQVTVCHSAPRSPRVIPESPGTLSSLRGKKFRRRPDSTPPRKRRARRRLNLVRSHEEVGGASDDSNSLPHASAACPVPGVWKKKQRVHSPPTSPAHTTATQQASNVSSGQHQHPVQRPSVLGCTGVERLMQRQGEGGIWTQQDLNSDQYLSEYSSGSTKPEHMKVSCADLFPLKNTDEIPRSTPPLALQSAISAASRPGPGSRGTRRVEYVESVVTNRDRPTSDLTCLSPTSSQPHLLNTLPRRSVPVTPALQKRSRHSSRVASLLDESSVAVSLSDATGPMERPRTGHSHLIVPSLDISPPNQSKEPIITPETFRGIPQKPPTPIDYWLLNQTSDRPSHWTPSIPRHRHFQSVPPMASVVRQRRVYRPPKPEKRKSRDCRPVTQPPEGPPSPKMPSPVKSEDECSLGECDVLSALSAECGNAGALDRVEVEPQHPRLPELIVIESDDALNVPRLFEPMIPGGRRNPIIIADEVIARSHPRSRNRSVKTSHNTSSTQQYHIDPAVPASVVAPVKQVEMYAEDCSRREYNNVPPTPLSKTAFTNGKYSTPIPCHSSDCKDHRKASTRIHEFHKMKHCDAASPVTADKHFPVHPSRAPLSPLGTQSVREFMHSPRRNLESTSRRALDNDDFSDNVQTTENAYAIGDSKVIEHCIENVDSEIGRQLGVTAKNGVLIFKPTISIYQGPPSGDGSRDRFSSRDETDCRNDSSLEKSTWSGISDKSNLSVKRLQDTPPPLHIDSGVAFSHLRQDFRQVSLSIARLEQKALEVDAVLSKALDLSAKVEQKLSGATFCIEDDDDGMNEELERLEQSESTLREELEVLQMRTSHVESRSIVKPTKEPRDAKHVSWSNSNDMLIDLTSVDDDPESNESRCWASSVNASKLPEAHRPAMEANRSLKSYARPQQNDGPPLKRDVGSTERYPVDLTGVQENQESKGSSESAYHSSESSSSGVLSFATRETMQGRSEYLYNARVLGCRLRKADDTTYGRVSSILHMINDPYPGAWMDQPHQSLEHSIDSSLGVGESSILILHHQTHEDVEVMMVTEEDECDDDNREEIEVIFVEESFLSTDTFSFGETKGVYFDWKKNRGDDSRTSSQIRFPALAEGSTDIHVKPVPFSSSILANQEPEVLVDCDAVSENEDRHISNRYWHSKFNTPRRTTAGEGKEKPFMFRFADNDVKRHEHQQNTAEPTARQALVVDCDPLVDTIIKIPTPRNPGPSRTSSDPPGCHNKVVAAASTRQQSPDGRYLDFAVLPDLELDKAPSGTASDVFSGIDDSVVDNESHDQSSLYFKRRVAAIMRRLNHAEEDLTLKDQSEQTLGSRALSSDPDASSTMMDDDNESLLSLTLSHLSAGKSVNSSTSLTSVVSEDAEMKLKNLLCRGKLLLSTDKAPRAKEEEDGSGDRMMSNQVSSDLSEWDSSHNGAVHGSNLDTGSPKVQYCEVRNNIVPLAACCISGKPPLAASSPASRRLNRLRRLQDKLNISSTGLVKSKREQIKAQPGRFLSARKRFSPISSASGDTKAPLVPDASKLQESPLLHSAAARMSRMVAKTIPPRRLADPGTSLPSKLQSPRLADHMPGDRSCGRLRISEELSKAVRVVRPKCQTICPSNTIQGVNEYRNPPDSISRNMKKGNRSNISTIVRSTTSRETAALECSSGERRQHLSDMPEFPDLLHPSLPLFIPTSRKDRATSKNPTRASSSNGSKSSLHFHARIRDVTSALPGRLLWEATRESSAQK